MAQFPALDPSGSAYDIHLWHTEYGSIHVWVGTPGNPSIASPGLEQAITEFADALRVQTGAESVIGVARFRTDSTDLPAAPTIP